LHFLQTFRNYRETFDKQKLAIEQRYRQLLDDSIQDAVFLSSRNNELVAENDALRLGKSLFRGLFVRCPVKMAQVKIAQMAK